MSPAEGKLGKTLIAPDRFRETSSNTLFIARIDEWQPKAVTMNAEKDASFPALNASYLSIDRLRLASNADGSLRNTGGNLSSLESKNVNPELTKQQIRK